jgi:hypothetical protein
MLHETDLRKTALIRAVSLTVSFLVEKGLISKHQHAFIKNHSTATNLLECLQDWSVGLNSRTQTDIIYIDFAKAFDSIVTSKLIYKLEFYGITGKLLKWIRGFLTDRSHRVFIDHCFSPNCSVKSGVPQGSVLGPLLFILYIKDIDSVCCGHTKLQLFADYAKLYCNINIENDSISLQQSLDRLVNWANMWQLSININKCAVLSLSIKHQPILRDYFIDDVSILHKDSYVDLGITIANSLSFEAHINGIVCKARQRVSTLFRGFITRNLSIMQQAFISYVRPILEYNSIICNPTYKYLIDAIEQVQHNFTKRILAIMLLPYPERLAILDLELLKLRRLRFDLIYYYKVLHNLTSTNPDDVFITYTRAENGPKCFGPARPVRVTTKAGPARPGPFRAGIFRELSLKCLRIVFYLFIFYRNVCFSGYFYCITYVFIVFSMFRETFRKFSSLDRGKGNTRHRPRHTTRPTGNEPGRAGPKFGSSAGARPGPLGKLEFSGPARPAGRPARSQL